MPVSDIPTPPGPVRIALLLVDGFALMSYASIIEPFRAANSLARSELYQWVHVSTGDAEIRASNGAALNADHLVGDPISCDRLFVFAAGKPSEFRDGRCFAWLRNMVRQGASIGGVSGGPYLLARAGLLAGYRATIHWEHVTALQEEFPDLAIEPGLYVIDRNRMTCAGGTAGLDLAISLIENDHGSELANRVGEWFIQPEPRRAGVSQRSALSARYGTMDQRLLHMLALMEEQLEDPLPRSTLAQATDLSIRQLERLCRQHLGLGIAEIYLGIRLDHAAQLLRSTGLSVTSIGLACGFRSTSHFSRCIKRRFGSPPSVLHSRTRGPELMAG